MHVKPIPKDAQGERKCCIEVAAPKHLAEYRAGRFGEGAQFCRKRVTIEIDGKPYCSGHGGQVALEHLIETSPDLKDAE